MFPGALCQLCGCFSDVGVLYNWFGDAISESESGKYSARIDVSYRWSMSWFIFSEVMFFAAFRRIVLCPQYFHAMAG
jgi:cytochrome c oxidase subunit 3